MTVIAHRCAVLGKPIAHSLSPVLHNAAYKALGLDAGRTSGTRSAKAISTDFSKGSIRPGAV